MDWIADVTEVASPRLLPFRFGRDAVKIEEESVWSVQ